MSNDITPEDWSALLDEAMADLSPRNIQRIRNVLNSTSLQMLGTLFNGPEFSYFVNNHKYEMRVAIDMLENPTKYAPS